MVSRFPIPIARSVRAVDPLLDLHREVNRLFDDLFSTGSFMGGSPQASLLSMPRLDLRENEQELCVDVELPGVKSSEVDLRLDGDLLTISGEKKNQTEQQKDNIYLTERSYGRFQRTVQLPFTPDPEQVRADFENGVLSVHLQKRGEAQQSRRIEVREASKAIGGPAEGSGASQEGSRNSRTQAPAQEVEPAKAAAADAQAH